MTHATVLWWTIFQVLDVLLLFIYNQLSAQFGPKAVFYINNAIWFLGVDIFHLYFTLALWTFDVPTIKEVQRRVVFYRLKPSKLEPEDQILRIKTLMSVALVRLSI